MKKLVLLFFSIIFSFTVFSQVVTDINAQYRHGQTFIKWTVIPDYTGFYYVYRYDFPITNANINFSKYMGRVPYNFSLDYFFNLGTNGGENGNPMRYLVINQDPLDSLDATKGLFVTTCSKQKTVYYAVTSDSAVLNGTVENRFIKPGWNATTSGVAEKVEPIEAILQVANLPLEMDPTLGYDSYAMFGGNVKTQYTPEFGNEGSLVFDFGIIPDQEPAGNNSFTMFFYGGGGNAYDNANITHSPDMWKISLEDVIPNFNWDSVSGENTKWIGYNENLDIYGANEDSPPPTTGIDKSYTIARIAWLRNWLLKTFPTELDSNRMYVHGASSGCTGALAISYLHPEWVASCDVVNAKLNTEYLGDDNPNCKWKIGGTSRERAEIFLGTLANNLISDIPKIDGTGNYNIWDWANFNNMLRDNKYKSLPFTFLTSGKEDVVTCWDEKIPFYKAINQNKSGGLYYWDLREHQGGDKKIKDNPLENFFKFSLKKSYPAFSNCSLNDDPGDTHNPQSPYYDGDDFGSINGVMDWDTTVVETPDSWQALVYTKKFELNDDTFYPFDDLPPYVRVDITPKRLQKFVNIPDGAIICMENWEGNVLKQSRSITYHPNSNGKGLLTFRKVKVRQLTDGGNLIRIYDCSSPKLSTTPLGAIHAGLDNIYPNPTNGTAMIDFSIVKDAIVTITVKNILGEEMLRIDKGVLTEGEQQLTVDLSTLPFGMYIVNVKAGDQVNSYKVIKD